MDRKSLQLLEFEPVLRLIARHAQSQAGRAAVLALRPSESRRWIDQRYTLTREIDRFQQAGAHRVSLADIDEPAEALQSLKTQESLLDGAQLVSLARLSRTVAESRQAFSADGYPALSRLLLPLDGCREVAAEVGRCLDPEGQVLDRAHPDLRKVRRSQGAVRARIQTSLETILRGPLVRHLIEDPYVTQRRGRSVLPVRRESRSHFEGILHGLSSSGATVFIEPMPVVELNNELQLLVEREAELCRQVLSQLSSLALRHREPLAAAAEALAGVDGLFAANAFARQYDARLAEFVDGLHFSCEEARHPLLLDTLGAAAVVPISLELTPEAHVLVISGPNTGGKTVALKTAGLLSLMAQSGLPVPARSCRLPLLSRVWVDLGDHQSIAQQLSSFSAHVQRLVEIEQSATPPCLVLLDEAGRATDAESGAALAAAVTDHLRRRGCLVIVTTHHSQLKYLAASEAGMANAGVQLDPKTLLPTYRVEMGVASTSSGLEIARQIGLSAPLIEVARRFRDDGHNRVEGFLAELRGKLTALERQRDDLSRKQARFESRRKDLDREAETHRGALQKRFERELDKLASEFRQRTAAYLDRVADRQEAQRLKLQTRAREDLLKEEFRQKMKADNRSALEKHPSARPLREGDRVVHPIWKEGRIVRLDGNRAVVDVGGKRVTAQSAELKCLSQPAPRRLPSNVSLVAHGEASRELNLIGERVEEAVTRADKFLDSAVVGQLDEVIIVHGFGTGALRRALAELLEDHPHVRSFRHGGGATRVVLNG